MAESSTHGRRKQARRNKLAPRSGVWAHFTRLRDDDGNETGKVECNSCGAQLTSRQGTSSLRKHVDKVCSGRQEADAAVGVGAARPPHQDQQPPPLMPATPPSPATRAHEHELHDPATHLSPAQVQFIQAQLHLQRSMKPAIPVPPAPAPQRPQKQYRGVRCVKWVADIRLPRKRTRLSLGAFDTAEEAALAYDQAAYRLHGDAARLHFPGDAASLPPLDPAVEAKLQTIFAPIAAAASSSSKNARAMEKAAPVNLAGSGSGDEMSAPTRCWEMELLDLIDLRNVLPEGPDESVVVVDDVDSRLWPSLFSPCKHKNTKIQNFAKESY